MKRLLLAIIFTAGISLAAESEKKPEIVPMGTQAQAIDLINRLIKANQSFIVKIANPILPGKMRLWQQRGLVRYPTKMTPWVTFKRDIQQFGSDLYNLLSKDSQTNKYYHLEALRKNHALYKELQSLDKTLSEYEPKIEMAKPFQLGKESLESMQKIINAYGTKFYQDKLLEQIKAVMKEFEKEAKEIRTKQEAAQRKASGARASSTVDLSEIDFGEYDPSGLESFEDYESFDASGSSFDLDDFGFDDDFISSFFE